MKDHAFPPVASETAPRLMSIRALGLALYRGRLKSFVALIACGAVALLVILVTPPSYVATTQVLLEPLPHRPIAVALDGVINPLDSAQADSRIRKRSRSST